jgi:hypothetical protein
MTVHAKDQLIAMEAVTDEIVAMTNVRAEDGSTEAATGVVEKLVELGWGPIPKISLHDLTEFLTRIEVPNVKVVNGRVDISAESLADAVAVFMRAHGIEVE